jgi:hypothetical protein
MAIYIHSPCFSSSVFYGLGPAACFSSQLGSEMMSHLRHVVGLLGQVLAHRKAQDRIAQVEADTQYIHASNGILAVKTYTPQTSLPL